jgi:hypothetical protein
MEAFGGGGEVLLLLILDLGTRWRWAVSVTPQARFTPGKGPLVPILVGPRAGLDAGARRKILCPCRGSNPDRPARSQTLYYLSCTGSKYFHYFFSVALQSLKDLGRLIYRRFLELFRHVAGLLGRVISPSQGLYLHRTTQHRKTRDKHPCFERDPNPRSQQPTGQDPRLRPHGHYDRHFHYYFQLLL